MTVTVSPTFRLVAEALAEMLVTVTAAVVGVTLGLVGLPPPPPQAAVYRTAVATSLCR